MSLHLLTFCLILASRVVDAFSGWLPFAGSVLQGRQALTLSRDAANKAASRSQQRTAPCRFHAHPNEYEVFFNKACKSGRALMSQLSPEERAQRAIEVCTSDVEMRRNLGFKGELRSRLPRLNLLWTGISMLCGRCLHELKESNKM